MPLPENAVVLQVTTTHKFVVRLRPDQIPAHLRAHLEHGIVADLGAGDRGQLAIAAHSAAERAEALVTEDRHTWDVQQVFVP
jgi:predicted RNA methylase